MEEKGEGGAGDQTIVEATQLTRDHKPDLKDEKARIEVGTELGAIEEAEQFGESPLVGHQLGDRVLASLAPERIGLQHPQHERERNRVEHDRGDHLMASAIGFDQPSRQRPESASDDPCDHGQHHA